MLPVDAAFSPWVAGAALAVLVGLLVMRALRRDRREYSLFKRYRSTVRRQRLLRKWLLQSFAWLGGAAVILLVVVWQFVGPFLAGVEGWPAMVLLRDSIESGGSLVRGFIIGAAIALAGVLVFAIFWAKPQDEIETLGDIEALLPRNRAELKYGWLLSINAGVVEELLFRLALPAALFAVTGSAVGSVVVSLVVFGAMHAYQGIGGVLGTLVFGAIMMAIFLLTGSILWPIIVHALFDLRSLVLIPMVVRRVHKIR